MRNKICNQCGKTKPIHEFSKNGTTRKGSPAHRGKCKKCEKLNNRKLLKDRQVPPEQVYSDPIYKICSRMASDALSRTKRDPCYSDVIYKFKGSGEMKWFLYKYFYKDIKEILESGKTPSVDRIDSSKGYSVDNIRILTFEENTRLGVENTKKKVFVKFKNGEEIIFDSTVDCVKHYGYPASHSNKVSCWVRNQKYKRPEDIQEICYYENYKR